MVHVIDAASGKVVKNIQVGKRPRRFAFTPDGGELWVTNELGASVTHHLDQGPCGDRRRSISRSRAARADDITPVGITMTRDGKRAFVALGRANHVAFVDVASRKVDRPGAGRQTRLERRR